MPALPQQKVEQLVDARQAPQLLVATVMGSVMRALFPGQPIWTMLAAALVMIAAAIAMLFVREPAA